jgi:uncharacterized protein VirK/YbjX
MQRRNEGNIMEERNKKLESIHSCKRRQSQRRQQVCHQEAEGIEEKSEC